MSWTLEEGVYTSLGPIGQHVTVEIFRIWRFEPPPWKLVLETTDRELAQRLIDAHNEEVPPRATSGGSLSDEELVRVWKCREHEDCYGTRHHSLADVKREANDCGPRCHCWRHTVIRTAVQELL